jgi:hypothetical protein
MKKTILIFFLVLLLGCATTGKLMNLELGMTKKQTATKVGKPDAVRGSVVNKYGQTIEVWEYMLYKTSSDAFYDISTSYWLFFCDGKLVQWGQAGDWSREADRIYEIRFKSIPPDSQ